MKSMYTRHFALTAGMILISFALLGCAFAVLSYQYMVRDKQVTLDSNATLVADFTATYREQGLDIRNEGFRAYILSLARISEAHVILCETNGEIVYSADGGGSGVADLVGRTVSAGIRQQVTTGGLSTLSTLGGLYSETRYVSGMPIVAYEDTPAETVIGMVFVSARPSAIVSMWQSFSAIFLFAALAVFLLAFLLASVTSRKQTRPIKELTAAVRQFGRGEYDVRMPATNRKDEVGELTEAFNAMADSIAKAEQKRSEFVANVSHELKTPMTTIAGFADGILDETIPPQRRRAALETISAETRRLSRLVRRMLDLSQLQSVDAVIAQQKFNAGEIVARALVGLETKINSKALDVIAELPEEPVEVWGEPDDITQVCYNLLDNAIKFSREGGHLWVSVTRKGDKALVTVRDEGETIPPEELPLIFDRFHKTDRSRSVDRDGVGLGLYIVKTILNNHQENISVTSADGLTEFVFTLTLA